jgi:hypothetical protein
MTFPSRRCTSKGVGRITEDQQTCFDRFAILFAALSCDHKEMLTSKLLYLALPVGRFLGFLNMEDPVTYPGRPLEVVADRKPMEVSVSPDASHGSATAPHSHP